MVASISPQEEWRSIEGFSRYEVSNHGRVRSLVSGNPRILSRIRHPDGYLAVGLFPDGGGKQARVTVHRLVAQAFIPNPDGLPFVRHRNDVPYENHVSNLAWGTAGDNLMDRFENSEKPERTHCRHGHALTPDNIYIDRGKKVCAICKRASVAASYQRKKARLGN